MLKLKKNQIKTDKHAKTKKVHELNRPNIVKAVEVGAKTVKKAYEEKSQKIEVVEDKQIYCICRQGDTGDHMIGCDGPSCTIEWFHWKCMGITKEPPGNWYCLTCKKAQSKGCKSKYGKSKEMSFKVSAEPQPSLLKSRKKSPKNRTIPASNQICTKEANIGKSSGVPQRFSTYDTTDMKSASPLDYRIPKRARNIEENKGAFKQNANLIHDFYKEQSIKSYYSASECQSNYQHGIKDDNSPRLFQDQHKNGNAYLTEFKSYDRMRSVNGYNTNIEGSYLGELEDYQRHRNNKPKLNNNHGLNEKLVCFDFLNTSQSEKLYNYR